MSRNVGPCHLTAPVERREQLALPQTAMPETLRTLCPADGCSPGYALAEAILTQAGTMPSTFLTETPVVKAPTARASHTAAFGRSFRALLEESVYLLPSQFKAGCTSPTHDDEALDVTLKAARTAFRQVL